LEANFVDDATKELGELTAEIKTRYRKAGGAELHSLGEDFIVARPLHRGVSSDSSRKEW
jgi:hypothetical protein